MSHRSLFRMILLVQIEVKCYSLHLLFSHVDLFLFQSIQQFVLYQRSSCEAPSSWYLAQDHFKHRLWGDKSMYARGSPRWWIFLRMLYFYSQSEMSLPIKNFVWKTFLVWYFSYNNSRFISLSPIGSFVDNFFSWDLCISVQYIDLNSLWRA